MNKQNSLLNYLKGIGCLCVVLLHARFPGTFGNIIVRLAQFAVPVFFMISGYYAYSQDRVKTERMLLRRTKRIFWISLISTGFYAVVYFSGLFTERSPLRWDMRWIVGRVLRFLLLQDLEVVGGNHLWFLWALLYDYLILIFINRHNAWKLFHKLTGILFMVTISLHFIRFYYGFDWHIDGNWLWGLPYVLMGHLIASRRECLDLFSNNVLGVLAVIGGGISLIGLSRPKYDFSESGIVLLSIALFSLAIKNPGACSTSWLTVVGERYALYIYVLHPFLKQWAIKMGIRHSVPWIYPLVVAMFSLIAAKIIVYIQSKYNRSAYGIKN